MTTLLDLFSLPYALRELLGREAREKGSAPPPRASTPSLRGPSEPPKEPTAAGSGSWEWCVAGDSSTHQRLTVAAVFAGRIG